MDKVAKRGSAATDRLSSRRPDRAIQASEVADDEEGEEGEEGLRFRPRFGADGLATCVAIDAGRGDVLMVAHMNESALRATIETGIVHYWSRSRGALWRKGDTSGQIQRLVELRVDCDQDAFLAFVEVGGDGGACHTGRRSCFYRRLESGPAGNRLVFVEEGKPAG